MSSWVGGLVSILFLVASVSLADYKAKPQYGNRNVLDKVYGDGECVALVREWTGAPETAKWKKGAQVKGNTNLRIGTAIATFNKEGKYEGHAAMYQGQNDKAITVIDQWKGRKANYRDIRFQGGKATKVSNDGDAYYVIE